MVDGYFLKVLPVLLTGLSAWDFPVLYFRVGNTLEISFTSLDFSFKAEISQISCMDLGQFHGSYAIGNLEIPPGVFYVRVSLTI